ncbi:SRP54-type protein [Russula vinacea]|nr:SRP54-type protein [Russula vinacea]
MVLSDLGRRLNAALSSLNRTPVVDEKVLDALLKEVCAALLESDVNVKLASQLRQKVRGKVKAVFEGGGEKAKDANRKNVVQKAIFDELVNLVDPGIEPYRPKKGYPNVIMAVGLQASVHYQKRGFKSSIVCADTFRAGAFDQTRQSATKAKVAYFGSYTETDPVAIAAQGVAKFKKEKFEVIIVDTSGRHKQESELFEEMKQIGSAVKPDMTVLVLDASIGQAAEAQSRAFKESADFGAIIVTKMDGHAKGGGAISAVAATKTPIIFLGTGEHLTDLDRFSPQPFISKLLGLGDKEMAKKLEEGKLSIRDWREQIQNVMNLHVVLIMSSAELDSDAYRLTWRVSRVARGSGTTVREVEELLCQYRMMANMAKQAGGKNGRRGGRGRGAGGMPTPAQIQAMQNSLPPGMLQQMQRQMRSGGGIQEMMKTLMQSQGGDQMDMDEMQRMMGQVGGLGGLGGLGGGMPNMSDMFKLMGMGRGGGTEQPHSPPTVPNPQQTSARRIDHGEASGTSRIVREERAQEREGHHGHDKRVGWGLFLVALRYT